MILEQMSFITTEGGEKQPETKKLNKRQIELIRKKVQYAAGDYCKITVPILEGYLKSKEIKFRKRSAKNTLLKIIEDQGLFEDFCTYAYPYVYVSPFDLESTYRITRDEAIKIAQIGVLETDGAVNSNGYTMFTLKALEYTRDELLEILRDKLGDTRTQFRIVVESKEQGQAVLEEMGQIYDIENVSAYMERKKDKDGYSLYFSTSKKDGRGSIHKENENAKLKAKLALLEEELFKAKQELRAFQMEQHRELAETEEYKKINEDLKNMKIELALAKRDVKLKEGTIESLKKQLEQITVGRPRKFSPSEEEKIAQLKESGLSMNNIAKEFKCSVGLVHKVLKSKGMASSRH